MLLRRERPSDVASIARIHRLAFAASGPDGVPPVEDRLVDALRSDPAWVPALSIVAEDGDGQAIGHVVATEGRFSAAAVGIGPLGVLPGHQDRGVGTALMHAVLAASDALGYAVAAVLGDPAYYSRFGFVPAGSLGIRPTDPSWSPHFQVRVLDSYAGETGTFHYAAPFDEL